MQQNRNSEYLPLITVFKLLLHLWRVIAAFREVWRSEDDVREFILCCHHADPGDQMGTT